MSDDMTNRLNDHSDRIRVLENKAAVSEVERETFKALIERVEANLQRVADRIDDATTWRNRLIYGLVIAAVATFIFQGGLNIAP